MLKQNRSITKLCLRLNKIGDAGCSAVAQSLHENDGTLKMLSLHWNQIGKEGAEALAVALVGGVQCAINVPCSLVELNLGVNRIGPAGAAALAGALAQNRILRLLHLEDNGLGNDGVAHLCRVLSNSNDTLTDLNLDWNSITDPGARHVSRMLCVNSTLCTLSLLGNAISEQGINALEIVLADGKNTTLSQFRVLSKTIHDLLGDEEDSSEEGEEQDEA